MVKDESGSHLVVFKNYDLRFFISFADFRSAADIFLFCVLERYETASFGPSIIVTALRSAGSAVTNDCSAAVGETNSLY